MIINRSRDQFQKRKSRVRKKIKGTPERPRVTVFKSDRNLYAQIIDDSKGHTLVSVSSLQKGVGKPGKNMKAMEAVARSLSEKALEKGIRSVVFDRNGYPYHGRVKVLADMMREKGIKV